MYPGSAASREEMEATNTLLHSCCPGYWVAHLRSPFLENATRMHPDLAQAAHLLLSIAGPASEQIEMSKTGPAKYYSVGHALTLDECAKHLQGMKTRGATLRHPGQLTRALAFDTDVYRLYPGWWWMLGAAQHLAEAGYRVLLEPSPAGRGGHLWIVFDDLVDARAARFHVGRLAPVLGDVGEYWPGPEWAAKWNKVRLPGGRYVAPEFTAWCKLYNANRQLLSDCGLAAARVLLAYQTPASIVPPLPADHQEDVKDPQIERPTLHLQREQRSVTPALDVRQERKYGTVNRFLWFRYTPHQIADWYNARHTTDDLLDFDRNGLANAGEIGRPERMPSLARTRDGQRWSDFGASAQRSDGRPDGGDVLELLVRMSGRCKAEVLRQLGQEMVMEARAELERAARVSVFPEQWVQDMMSEAGWARYWSLRKGQV